MSDHELLSITTNQLQIDYLLLLQGMDDFQTIYFDSVSNKQRIDMHVVEPTDRHVQLFLRHDLGKGFEYDVANNTCRSWPLPGKLQPYCLVQGATKENDIVLGGQLKCETWVEEAFGFSIRVIIAPGTPHNIPVNVISRGGHNNGWFQEFWNFQGTDGAMPDQSVFNVPTACMKVSESDNYVLPQEIIGMHGWMNKNMK